jgi:hypothetical protein
MRFIKTVSVVVVIMALASGVSVCAQATGAVTIKTDPPGAWVTLKGDGSVSGLSPALFQQPLIGEYSLIAKKPGYETKSTKVLLQPGRPLEFSMKLSRKTGLKAGLRSIIIPGWGQRYSEREGRGLAFLGLTVLSGVAYLIVDNNFDKKLGEYSRIKFRYDSLSSAEDRQALWPSLRNAQNDAYDLEDIRRVTIGLTAGFWIVSVLDAVLRFPDTPGTVPIKGLTLAPEVKPGEIGLTLSGRF